MTERHPAEPITPPPRHVEVVQHSHPEAIAAAAAISRELVTHGELVVRLGSLRELLDERARHHERVHEAERESLLEARKVIDERLARFDEFREEMAQRGAGYLTREAASQLAAADRLAVEAEIAAVERQVAQNRETIAKHALDLAGLGNRAIDREQLDSAIAIVDGHVATVSATSQQRAESSSSRIAALELARANLEGRWAQTAGFMALIAVVVPIALKFLIP